MSCFSFLKPLVLFFFAHFHTPQCYPAKKETKTKRLASQHVRVRCMFVSSSSSSSSSFCVRVFLFSFFSHLSLLFNGPVCYRPVGRGVEWGVRGGWRGTSSLPTQKRERERERTIGGPAGEEIPRSSILIDSRKESGARRNKGHFLLHRSIASHL